MLALALLALLAGSWVYLVMIVIAARRWIAVPSPALVPNPEPVSILKPLAGLDEGLEANLRTFFTQSYSTFEILFAVRSSEDPAVDVVSRLRAEFPHVPTQLIVTGEPPYPNAKVYSLDKMMVAARNDLLVMSDSDIRVDATMLGRVAAEFQDPKIGVATCPYRAIAGSSLWSKLEAIGMNTEFFGGVLVARLLEGMHFAVGPTIVARKRALQQIGGFERLKDYLAEDFVMGQFAAATGWGVILSKYVVEHRIGSETWTKNAAHRIRWARSTRRSRPAGYVGQFFTNPTPIALALVAVAPEWWPQLVVTGVLRAVAAWIVARQVLGTRVGWRFLIPQDLLSFTFWVAGFFGNSIHWRGRRYRLHQDGKFTLEEPRS